ncbi:folylpolyglutamate synthase/dihydrofolate synthase family protein [soil metagenome]
MTAAPAGQAAAGTAARPIDLRGYEAAVAALVARRPEWMVPGLKRIRALCREAGEPQHAYRAVHVTGTNGKTTTARMVTSLLVAAGHRVGTYTSPHLQDLRERIRIDDVPVDREGFLQGLADLSGPVERVEHRLGDMVTFFEVLTALGAVRFRDGAIDVGVIEVGMGGRWDATNVHDAEVAVIGRVGLDHPELGASLAEVAWEKAGIVKAGATAVLGPQPAEAVPVIRRAAEAHGALLLQAGTHFAVEARAAVPGGQDCILRVGGRRHAVHLPLHGAHQATNAACALAAVDALLDDTGGIGPDAVRAGFARVRSPGRLEVFDREGLAPVVLDGAHNPDGARALVAALAEAFPGRRVVAILGMLADKDVAQVTAAILEVADTVVATQSPCGRVAAAPQRLAELARGRARTVAQAPDVVAALAVADALAEPCDVVVVTGSLYLAGAAREALGGWVA